jgi:aspartyl-tRNA(Asn)/glutamyl-tRNA(Gln) amidotransferase subunit A
MSDLIKLTIVEALAKLKSRALSVPELVQAHLAAMEHGRGLNAYITETPELALQQAADSQAKWDAGTAGLLEGVPIGIKDLFCTNGVRTTAGSKILENFVPPYESTVTAKLRDAGAVTLGKLNLDEFAMGSANTTSYFGPVINPWKRQSAPEVALTPGGSSGGSAAAVAAHLAMAATGTDTGGSIRQPAAFCGLVGIKPTYGRCSRWGTIAFASSLDQAGVLARSVGDAALTLQAMAGFDPLDSTSVDMPVPNFFAELGGAADIGKLNGLRVGIPAEYDIDGLNPECRAFWQQGQAWLKEMGAIVVPVNLPHTSAAMAVYYVLAPAEASSNLSRYDGVRFGFRAEGKNLAEMYENTRGQGFGKEVKRRILIGTYVLSAGYFDAYYRKAQQVRALVAQDFRAAFDAVDVLLAPTAPTAAFGLGEGLSPIEMYLNDVFTIPASLAGLPAMSVPVGLSRDGLPMGLQLIGRPFDEVTVLKTAAALEGAAGFAKAVEGMGKAA